MTASGTWSTSTTTTRYDPKEVESQNHYGRVRLIPMTPTTRQHALPVIAAKSGYVLSLVGICLHLFTLFRLIINSTSQPVLAPPTGAAEGCGLNSQRNVSSVTNIYSATTFKSILPNETLNQAVCRSPSCRLDSALSAR